MQIWFACLCTKELYIYDVQYGHIPESTRVDYIIKFIVNISIMSFSKTSYIFLYGIEGFYDSFYNNFNIIVFQNTLKHDS